MKGSKFKEKKISSLYETELSFNNSEQESICFNIIKKKGDLLQYTVCETKNILSQNLNFI